MVLEREVCLELRSSGGKASSSGPGGGVRVRPRQATWTRAGSRPCPRSARPRRFGSWWACRYRSGRTPSGRGERAPCTWPLERHTEQRTGQ